MDACPGDILEIVTKEIEMELEL